MSNKVTELYNNIIENNTPEEIDRLRQLLSITKNTDINSKACKIRILSKSEYNKCITTGTADGSIITNNDNVWHNFRKNYGFFMSEGWTFDEAWNYVISKRSLLLSKGEFKWRSDWRSHSTSSYTYTDSCSTTIELLSNNSNANFNCFQFIVEQVTVNGPNYNNYVVSNVSKNATNWAASCNKYTGYGNNYNISISVTIGFRPVFDFIDNNKSTNIHY